VVELVSPEDIFLFKAVAGRVDDIEDMFSLMQTGLEFDVVQSGTRHAGRTLGARVVRDVRQRSVDRSHRATQRDDTVARPCCGDHRARVYEELEVLHALDEPKSVTDLQQELDWPAADVQEIVRRLEEKTPSR